MIKSVVVKDPARTAKMIYPDVYKKKEYTLTGGKKVLDNFEKELQKFAEKYKKK